MTRAQELANKHALEHEKARWTTTVAIGAHAIRDRIHAAVVEALKEATQVADFINDSGRLYVAVEDIEEMYTEETP